MQITALTGTVAIVTGASSGIGEATARRLAEHGAAVAVLARRRDRLDALVANIQAAGSTALTVEADITDRTQAERAVQTVVDTLGRLDILINNAGLMLLGPITGADIEEWEQMIAINQKGLLYVTRAALPHLLSAAQDQLRGVADIVNISSIAGRQAWANFGVYNMTKFGVNGFTEALRSPLIGMGGLGSPPCHASPGAGVAGHGPGGTGSSVALGSASDRADALTGPMR